MGVAVKGLILIDAPAPQMNSPFPDALIDYIVERRVPPHRIRDRIREHLKTQMKYATRALAAHDPSATIRNGTHIPTVYMRSRDAANITSCNTKIDPRVRAFLTKDDDTWTIPQWKEALGGQMEVLDIPGDHFSVFDEQNVSLGSIRSSDSNSPHSSQVGKVSEQMQKAIQILLSER